MRKDSAVQSSLVPIGEQIRAIVRAHPDGDAGVRSAVLLWKDLEKKKKATALTAPDPAMTSIKHYIDGEDDTLSVAGLGRALHNAGVLLRVGDEDGASNLLPDGATIDRLRAFAAEIPGLLADDDERISVPGFLRWLGRVALKKSISHERWMDIKASEERAEQRNDDKKLQLGLSGDLAALRCVLDAPESDVLKVLRASSNRILPPWAVVSEAAGKADEWLQTAEGSSAAQNEPCAFRVRVVLPKRGSVSAESAWSAPKGTRSGNRKENGGYWAPRVYVRQTCEAVRAGESVWHDIQSF